MKVYAIEVHEYDYCNNWVYVILHCMDKKFLGDLCKRLNKKYGSNMLSFSVIEVNVLDTPTKEEVKSAFQESMGWDCYDGL